MQISIAKKTSVAAVLWSCTFTGAAYGNIYVTGTAYKPDTEQVLYIEKYIRESATQTRVQYLDDKGKLVAEKRLDFSRNEHAPDVNKSDFRLDSQLSVSTRDNTTRISAQRNGEEALEASIETGKKLVIDAGFDPFIQANWDELLASEVLKFRFLVPARKTAVKLKVSKADCAAEQARVCFRIKAANWIIGALMTPIDLEYDRDSSRLLRFTGLGQLRDDQGKGQKVDIHYRYPDSKQG